jgi:DNA processing protein
VRHALDLGREVLAVPGSPLDPRYAGCNGLIRQGATLLSEVGDLGEFLPTTSAHKDDSDSKTEGQARQRLDVEHPIVKRLRAVGAMHIDELVTLGDEQTASLLLTLELEQLINRLPGGVVRWIGGHDRQA